MPTFLAPFLLAGVRKVGIVPIFVSLVLIAVALLGWLSLRTIAALVDDARAVVVAERNAYWEGRIEKANAAAEKKAAEQLAIAMKIEAAANDRVRAAEQKLTELEKENAALPDGGSVGLSRDRVRLLAR